MHRCRHVWWENLVVNLAYPFVLYQKELVMGNMKARKVLVICYQGMKKLAKLTFDRFFLNNQPVLDQIDYPIVIGPPIEAFSYFRRGFNIAA